MSKAARQAHECVHQVIRDCSAVHGSGSMVQYPWFSTHGPNAARQAHGRIPQVIHDCCVHGFKAARHSQVQVGPYRGLGVQGSRFTAAESVVQNPWFSAHGSEPMVQSPWFNPHGLKAARQAFIWANIHYDRAGTKVGDWAQLQSTSCTLPAHLRAHPRAHLQVARQAQDPL